MGFWILLGGLGLSLGGALVAAVADARLMRSLLTYLDAVEADLARLVRAVREGKADFEVSGADLRRDDEQNEARRLKTLGWLALAAGFGLQLVGVFLTRYPG